MNYYISDLHISHSNVILFDSRPFQDTDAMNSAIFGNWNARVKKNDTVYIIGDFIWGKESGWSDTVSRLSGRKVLIRGNHDPKTFSPETRALFEDICDYREISDCGKTVIMCHYPIPFYKNDFGDKAVMLYGHVHTTTEYEYLRELRKKILKKTGDSSGPKCNFINVGAMMPYMDYTPRTLNEIIEGDLSYRKTKEFLHGRKIRREKKK